MCTTVIVGKAVSKTGRVIVGHNEDAGGRSLHQSFFYPAADHAPGEMLTAEPGCARLPQAPHTLGVYWSNMLAPAPGSSFDQGFANDAGLVLCSNAGGTAFDAESTDLTDGGVGFLFRRVIAERARTAREAVEIARDLVTRYGYAGEARNYTVADKDEAWCINVVRGRHFVAKRVPDDRVMLISNMLAIRSVDLSDKANVVASPDLIEYAIAQGRYSPAQEGCFDDFDFARAYQSDENRRNPEKSIRMREGWLEIAGLWCADELHYPETLAPKAPMGVEEVKAVLRLTAPETYRTRGDGRADAFHVSAVDISRSHTRESWVMEFAQTPLLSILWRDASYQDTGVYVPWFPIAGAIPESCAITTLDEARRVHFAMKPQYLDFDYSKYYWLAALLGELVNFDRGLMAGVWASREALEASFRQSADALLARAAQGKPAEPALREALAQFTAASQAAADERARELLAELDVIEVSSDRDSLPAAEEAGLITIAVAAESSFDPQAVDPASLRWSLGFTASKPSALAPAEPIRVEEGESGELRCVFRAGDVARYAPAGVLCDTYIRGFCAGRRFVGMTAVRFTAPEA